MSLSPGRPIKGTSPEPEVLADSDLPIRQQKGESAEILAKELGVGATVVKEVLNK